MEGVIACCARRSDSDVSSHCYRNWLSAAQLEQALDSLVLAAKNLSSQGIHPVQLCSVFEHLRIYLSVREDGGYLALFVENRPTKATDSLHRLLEEFRAVAF